MRTVSIVVPTFNERENVEELARQLGEVVPSAEVIFVDDSNDDTPRIIEQMAASNPAITLVERGRAGVGGLAGAVAEGIARAAGELVVVMDGDLQHPPAVVRDLLAQMDDADLAVASRYLAEDGRSGLSSWFRHVVTWFTTTFVALLFPRRVGRRCTDPMTGFFCVRKSAVDLTLLRPRGFKILLEILATHDLRVAEVPFRFGTRNGGESKASLRTGLHFFVQVLQLRLTRRRTPERGPLARKLWFAFAGLTGVAVSFGSLYYLIDVRGMNIGVAYAIQTILAIETNFLLNDRFTWSDRAAGRFWTRFARFHIARVGLMIPVNQLVFFFTQPVLGTIVANLVCLTGATLVNWFINDRWTFKSRPSRVAIETQEAFA